MGDRLARAAAAVLHHWRQRDHVDPEDGFVLDELAIALAEDDGAEGGAAALLDALAWALPLLGRDGWLTEDDETRRDEIARLLGAGQA